MPSTGSAPTSLPQGARGSQAPQGTGDHGAWGGSPQSWPPPPPSSTEVLLTWLKRGAEWVWGKDQGRFATGDVMRNLRTRAFLAEPGWEHHCAPSTRVGATGTQPMAAPGCCVRTWGGLGRISAAGGMAGSGPKGSDGRLGLSLPPCSPRPPLTLHERSLVPLQKFRHEP